MSAADEQWISRLGYWEVVLDPSSRQNRDRQQKKNSFQHTFRFIHFHGIAAIVIMRDVEKVLTVSDENNGSTTTATSAGPDGIAPVPLGRA